MQKRLNRNRSCVSTAPLAFHRAQKNAASHPTCGAPAGSGENSWGGGLNCRLSPRETVGDQLPDIACVVDGDGADCATVVAGVSTAAATGAGRVAAKRRASACSKYAMVAGSGPSVSTAALGYTLPEAPATATLPLLSNHASVPGNGSGNSKPALGNVELATLT